MRLGIFNKLLNGYRHRSTASNASKAKEKAHAPVNSNSKYTKGKQISICSCVSACSKLMWFCATLLECARA